MRTAQTAVTMLAIVLMLIFSMDPPLVIYISVFGLHLGSEYQNIHAHDNYE